MAAASHPPVNDKHRGQFFAPDHFFRRLLVALWACIFLVGGFLPIGGVHSQAQGALLVQAPDLSAFPQVTVQFKLPISPAAADENLELPDLRVLENGQEATIAWLEKERSGVHFTLAINGGREFDWRDPDGASNYQKLRDLILEWTSGWADGPEDEWSLVVSGGTSVFNLTSRTAWQNALQAYAPDFRSLAPDLSSLATAIELAEARVVPFGVDKGVLYLTTPPTVSQIDEIFATAQQARAAGIQVHVWMIGDPIYVLDDQGGSLLALAEQTGGTFFQFSGPETLPETRSMLSDLGFLHTLQYESLVRSPGTHSLQISADLDQGTYQGDPVPFYLDIRPPQPILVDPPGVISRSEDPAGPAITSGALMVHDGGVSLYPDLIFIQIMVGFPDGRVRELASSRLLVNGVVMDVNPLPPFDVLSWDISKLTQPGEQTLEVEVVDAWGLVGRTNEYPVRIDVPIPEDDPGLSTRQITLLIGGGFAGLGVLALLAWGAVRLVKQHIKPLLKWFPPRDPERKQARSAPVSSVIDPVLATLIPLGRLDPQWEEDAIRITKHRVVFGGDPRQADVVLAGPDVGRVQACLTYDGQGFWLADLGSPSGTWVSYSRVGRQAVRVRSGDLVHFGNCGFRFTMVKNTLPDDVHIQPYEPLL